MRPSFAPLRGVRSRLCLAILCGIVLSGCGGGGGGAQTSIDGPAGTATDMIIGLAWAPSPDPVDGYNVYSGPTRDAATTRVAESLSPSIEFNAGTDLSLSYGDRVCFRVRAYVGAQESEPSEPACTII